VNTRLPGAAGGGRIVVGIPMLGAGYQGHADPNAPAPTQGHIGQQPKPAYRGAPRSRGCASRWHPAPGPGVPGDGCQRGVAG